MEKQQVTTLPIEEEWPLSMQEEWAQFASEMESESSQGSLRYLESEHWVEIGTVEDPIDEQWMEESTWTGKYQVIRQLTEEEWALCVPGCIPELPFLYLVRKM
jgi:hypothetical protein